MIKLVTPHLYSLVDLGIDIEQSTMEECVEFCRTKKILFCDTETSGLDFVVTKVLMLQIGDRDVQYVIDTRFVDVEPLREILESKSILKVFQNVSFDYKQIRSSFGIVLENVADTMLIEQILENGQDTPANLDYLSVKYTGEKLQKQIRNRFIGMKGEPFTIDQIIYGAKDVSKLQEIYDAQRERYEGEEFEKTIWLENNAVLALSDIEYNGMKVDHKAWLALENLAQEAYDEYATKLDNYILTNPIFNKFVPTHVQGDLFGDPRRLNLSWTSPKQVLQVMKVLVPDIESVNSNILKKHKRLHPIIPTYIAFSEQKKKVSSYGKAFLDLEHKDGKVHTSFRQILHTGRISSSDPNMQQIPSDVRYRNAFIPFKENQVFVSADYSSQELCIIAVKSQDPVWLEALRNSEDLHSICAHLVFGKEWEIEADPDCAYNESKQKCECAGHKKLRTAVKSINFGLAYGMSEFKLADQMDISVKEAAKLIETYFKTFPKIQAFLTILGNYGVSRGYIKTFPPFLRRRYFKGWSRENMADNFKFKGDVERASKNTPIQGTGADMVKYALIKVRDAINSNPEYKEKVLLVMTVHDQIDTLADKDIAEAWAQELQRCMEEAAEEILKTDLLKADPNITPVWSK